MINKILIKNYAIIEYANIGINPGFTVITGETGAGKSLLLEATGVVLGMRADRMMVRDSMEKAVIEATFQDASLRRVVYSKGGSRSFKNGEGISLTDLKRENKARVDFHGQHDQQFILDKSTHIEYLDRYCGHQGMVRELEKLFLEISNSKLMLEQIKKNESQAMAAGAAMQVVGWWTGYKIGGVISLVAAEFFQQRGFENYWQISFLFMGLIVIISSSALLFVPEEDSKIRNITQKNNDDKLLKKLQIKNQISKMLIWIYSTLFNPLVSFFKKNSLEVAVGLLSFIFLFKIGEAFLGRMSIIFYKEIGFTKTDIALYSKGIGWITTISFTLLGGLFAIRMGLLKAMFVSGIVMSLTNLMFSVLSWVGNSEILFALTVLLDDLAAAFATVAFVAFISALVDRTYTATQFALLASIGTAGRTLFASSSGSLVDWLNGDWGIFL